MRKSYIDVMKGIGMIFVLLGHRYPDKTILIYIYSFHMPMFFFISGYLFKNDKYINYNSIIISKFKTLLVPYFIFAICSLILKPTSVISFIEQLFILKGITVWNGPLWFLMCLFVVELLFYSILKISKNRKSIIIILLLFCAGIGYFFSKMNYRLPLKVDTAFVAVVFFGVGYLFGNITIGKNKLIKMIVVIVTTILTFLLSNYGLGIIISMNRMVYGNYIYFIFIALIGIVSIYILSVLISKSFILEYIGRNSLIILSVHYVIFFYIDEAIATAKLPLCGYGNKSAVIITIFTLLSCIPIVYIINNYLPFILGKSKGERNARNVSSKL